MFSGQDRDKSLRLNIEQPAAEFMPTTAVPPGPPRIPRLPSHTAAPGSASTLDAKLMGGRSRRRDCHSADAPPSTHIETPTEERGGVQQRVTELSPPALQAC